MFAEHAVILADIIMPGGKNLGPHLFYTRIQNRDRKSGEMSSLAGVEVTSLPEKTALRGLDNAYVMFDRFEVPRDALLSRFSRVDERGEYRLCLPAGAKRMLDLLISRLLTGRVCLSEYTISYAQVYMHTYIYDVYVYMYIYAF
jgi:alkylation response protein AidB-like acyl-CoA dehydrogenase